MKRSLIGWTGKDSKLEDLLFRNLYKGSRIEIDGIFYAKGVKDDWDRDDWPPQKVKVTVELANANK